MLAPESLHAKLHQIYVGREETSSGSGIAKGCDLVSLLHVVRVEQMPQSSSAAG